MEKFNGKAIYNPSGKAGEYSKWACNFYVGCSNGCEYCYCKKGILGLVMGQDKPQLKKCFKDEYDAFQIFKAEVWRNLSELKKHGLFFSFTTDPMLPETKKLTMDAIIHCVINNVPVKILTKCTEWLDKSFLSLIDIYERNSDHSVKSLIAFGFTLTGHDELEKGAAPNKDRIRAMQVLSDEGFKVWASIEPIIHLSSASKMILKSWSYCDLYKVGLLSGKKFDKIELNDFVYHTAQFCYNTPVYFKDSLLKAAGIERAELPENCVTRDYNIFSQ